jgi:inosose dehydratase
MVMTRRDLLKAAASAFPASYVASGSSRSSCDNTAASIKYGYAAITWGANVTQAIDDISALGFRGIQLRSEAFAQFSTKPAALRELLDKHRLKMAVLSSGNLSIDPAKEQEEIANHVHHAKFVKAVGGEYLQVIDERPKGRPSAAEDYRRLGRLLSKLGQRTADEGVPLVYHHHMNSLGEKPPEVAAVLDAADRHHVRVLFDVAHYQQAGGDPVSAIRKYRDWIQVLHLKDVRSVEGGTGYQFVELGQGRVDLPGVFAALNDISFDGWAIVELDRVPDPNRTPKEAAETNKKYLVERAHQRI